jgi:hypothetical protein
MLPEKVETLFDKLTVKKPSIINVEGGVTIRVDKDKNVTIEGHNSLKFCCDGDLDFDADNINLHARSGMTVNVDGEIYMGSSRHIIQQAPRIDLNPYDGIVSGYYGNIKNKVLEIFDFIRYNNRNMKCEEIDESKR